MSRGAMNKDVKYYCTRCQELEQELAELKKLVREFGSCKIRIGNHDKDVRKRNAKYERLMQAVGLANTDSKEE